MPQVVLKLCQLYEIDGLTKFTCLLVSSLNLTMVSGEFNEYIAQIYTLNPGKFIFRKWSL